ncbi:MAG: tripartite tricarboxylate transporter TctB family protein [Rhodospirillales bacterium]
MRVNGRSGIQDIATGSAFLAVSAGLLVSSSSLPAGAAMLPHAALWALSLLSVALMIRGIRARWMTASADDGEEVQPFMENPRRLLLGILAMALYIVGIETVGFYISTALFIPLTAFVLGARNRLAIGMAGAGFVLFCYAVFSVLFERVLPEGLLFSVLQPGLAGMGVHV